MPPPRSNDFFGQPHARAASGAFALGHWTARPGQEALPAHGHHEPHLMAVLAGEMESDAAGNPPLGRMPLIFNPAQTWHRDRFRAGFGSFFSITILGDAHENADEYALPSHPVHVDGLPARSLVARIARECASWSSDSALVADGLAHELLGSFAPRVPAPDPRAPAWLARILERLHDSGEDPAVHELAACASVHPVHLGRTFRRHLRTTPGEYRRSLKLERAARLLADPRRPLAEVAQAAGFADQAHLTKLFARYYGTTPGRFRRMLT